jgi:predicted nucleotidyltransferase
VDYVHPVSAVIPGAQGRILDVLVQTTAELSVRTIARLAGISAAQASRVLPDLVDLGIVERREVPPSSQFRLVRSNVAAQALIALSRARQSVLDQIGEAAAALPTPPVSVIVFGSFARGEATSDSDLDIVVVRPDELDEDDTTWNASIDHWRDHVRATAGNPVEVLEVSRIEVAAKLGSRSTLWREVTRDGVVVHGLPLDELRDPAHAGKAEEYAAAAANELKAERYIAATSLAIRRSQRCTVWRVTPNRTATSVTDDACCNTSSTA